MDIRKRLAVAAAIACALAAASVFAVGAAPAAAETGGGMSGYSGLDWPTFELSVESESWSLRIALESEQSLRLVSPEEAVIERAGVEEGQIVAPLYRDAAGVGVPATLAVSEGDVLTLTVHHHQGTYDYPIASEEPWILIESREVVPVQ